MSGKNKSGGGSGKSSTTKGSTEDLENEIEILNELLRTEKENSLKGTLGETFGKGVELFSTMPICKEISHGCRSRDTFHDLIPIRKLVLTNGSQQKYV